MNRPAANPYPLVLTNWGTTPLTINSTSVTGDFSITGGCKEKIQPSGSCSLDLSFKPSATGTRTGTLTITDSNTTSPQTVVNLVGQGTAVSLSQTPVIFGGKLSTGYPAMTPFGATITEKVTLKNNSTTSLTISNMQIGGEYAAQYTQTNNCVRTFVPGQSCTITTTFTPTIGGFVPAPLTITSNDPASPQILYLQGYGIPISVPANVTLPGTPVGTTTTQNVVITNVANTTVTFGNFTTSCWNNLAGDCNYYTQTNNCGTSLAVGQSCTVTVSFTPGATGSSPGNLFISDNDPSSPQILNLSGTGLNAGSARSNKHAKEKKDDDD
jgi:Abnormal spindle-like microcephaly-assoc'd, ASPM-SPD-2-Hydin